LANALAPGEFGGAALFRRRAPPREFLLSSLLAQGKLLEL